MRQGQVSPKIVVAIDRDKSSHSAFKWALDNVVTAGQTLTLLHVNNKSSRGYEDEASYVASITRDIINPFRCFCTRKNVGCKDVIVESINVAKAIVEFVTSAAVEKLVIGASPKGGFIRSFKSIDLSTSIYKGVPDFCTIYVISKGKISSMRNATRHPSAVFPLHAQIEDQPTVTHDPPSQSIKNAMKGPSEAAVSPWNMQKETELIGSPFNRGGAQASSQRSYESDISFVSNDRPSTNGCPPRSSNLSDSYEYSFESSRKSTGAFSAGNESSYLSHASSSSQSMDDVEGEIRRLRLELQQTMDMYSTACKEALTAKQKAMELQRWKIGEEKRLEEASFKTTKRFSTEMKSDDETEEKKGFNDLSHTDLRYRRYTIEEIEAATEHFAENRKIGEGGYGPVYKCYLDHTPVAIKVLRPDAAHGRSQFQQEVEILCCIRHPNMVLLLGACPEYGCLVYEHMALGSLEDRLFKRGNTPPIPWQHRFRIAAEIGTSLLFLHQTKPEPLVHRDLKPANILLDRNYVSKISDVGLARLVPPSVANSVTQYRMTATAGTFCYIDPEYQQTGMLGTKSDVYSLGILLLQLITAKPPMGLTHSVERAIDKGTFPEMLDQSVSDWPVDEALSLAKIALKCAELRRKDRPDLGTVILPELNRLRELAEENLQYAMFGNGSFSSSMPSQVSVRFLFFFLSFSFMKKQIKSYFLSFRM
ncbi:U-box domain-containing protein 35-like [Curcuma longa]|uniref:U-box domain-containing protein 35-like n=1 Tax=Curcuma longa TaxID=136217 RepID=UPI003D9E73C9